MDERKSQPTEDTSAREMVITRLVDAPRELVFDAFTKPEHVAHWWGPDGFSTTIQEMDVRPGGRWTHTMHGPDGTDYPNHIVYIEVSRPERLMYSHGDGKVDGSGTHFTSTITFEDQCGKTLVTLRALFDTVAECERTLREANAIEGGKQTLGRLADYLPRMGGDQVLIQRIFDAPRELVFRAWTEAEHLAEWWGPKGFGLRVVSLDMREGGMFHYCSTMPNGQEVYGVFLYREVTPPERIVFLSGFADKDANLARHPMMPAWPRYIRNTVTLTEADGRTTLIMHGVPHEPTEEEKQAFKEALKYLAPGMNGTLDQLEAHLARVQGRA